MLVLFLLALIVLFIVIYVFPTVSGALTRTSFVEYGSIQTTDDVTAYFVRNEKVYRAKSAGEIQYYFDEGEFLRKGERILSVSPGSSYTASENGVVSYYIDGLENVLTPDKMASLKEKDVESASTDVASTRRKETVKGDPLYKMVDNTNWYVVFWVGEDDIVKYKKDAPVYLELPKGEIKGKTKEILDNGDSWFVILQFNRYYEDMPRIRKINTSVITAKYEGLVIANKSITAKGGKTGVFVKDINGEYDFTPVSVITSNGEYSLVESSFYYEDTKKGSVKVPTVNAYDEILNNPEGE